MSVMHIVKVVHQITKDESSSLDETCGNYQFTLANGDEVHFFSKFNVYACDYLVETDDGLMACPQELIGKVEWQKLSQYVSKR